MCVGPSNVPIAANNFTSPAPVAPITWPGSISRRPIAHPASAIGDRKSTRLNSSHGYISYAVFCLKQKHDDGHLLEERIRNDLEHDDPDDLTHDDERGRRRDREHLEAAARRRRLRVSLVPLVVRWRF